MTTAHQLNTPAVAELLSPHTVRSLKLAGPKAPSSKANSASCPGTPRRAENASDRPAQFEVPRTRGLVGRLARRVLIDPSGTPYEDVAMIVNHFVPGARVTAKSVSWYASRMRREGLDVPARAPLGSVCVVIEDPATVDR